jgi:hypothetical protein
MKTLPVYFFRSKDDILFDSTKNILIIRPFSLSFVQDRVYRFMISVIYLDKEYTQEIDITVLKTNQLPIPILRYFSC